MAQKPFSITEADSSKPAVLEPQLRSETKQTNPTLPHLQVLTTIGFLATGTFQRETGDRSDISQSTVSHVLLKVLKGIIQLTPQYIQFPYSAAQQTQIKRDYYAIAGLPNTIGAIDCTHVRIKAPSSDPFPFLNIKQFQSINIQIMLCTESH